MTAMAKWPKSRVKQAAIAFAVAFLATVWVFVQIEYGYFERFYFGPHKAYPYPFPTSIVPKWRFTGIAASLYYWESL
jgi:hypothetical protein